VKRSGNALSTRSINRWRSMSRMGSRPNNRAGL
jgi:hypothetical protein